MGYWSALCLTAIATTAVALPVGAAIGVSWSKSRVQPVVFVKPSIGDFVPDTYSTETFSGVVAALVILTAETRLRAKLGRLAEETQVPAAIPEPALDAARRALTAYEQDPRRFTSGMPSE